MLWIIQQIDFLMDSFNPLLKTHQRKITVFGNQYKKVSFYYQIIKSLNFRAKIHSNYHVAKWDILIVFKTLFKTGTSILNLGWEAVLLTNVILIWNGLIKSSSIYSSHGTIWSVWHDLEPKRKKCWNLNFIECMFKSLDICH